MALTSQDLKLLLKVEPDTREMDAAVKKLGKSVDQVYAQAKVETDLWQKTQKSAIEGAIKSLGVQAREIEKIKVLSSPDLLREQVRLDNEQSLALAKQTKELEKQKELLDPKYVKERIKLEKEITESRERQAKALEYARRGGTAGAVGRGVGGALTGAPLVKGLGNLVGDLQSPLGPLTTVFKGVGGLFNSLGEQVSKFGIVGKAAGGMLQGISSGIGVLLEVAGKLIGAVQMANPAVFEQFQIVLEDVMGVVGEMLVPVLQLFTDIARTLGDAIATILPNGEEMQQVLDTLRPAIADLTAAFKEFWGEVGPLFRDFLISYLKDLAGVAVIAARAIADVTRNLTQFLRSLGIIGSAGSGSAGSGRGMRSSVGAAARQANIQGIEQYQQELQKNAFSIPGRTTPVENIDSNVGLITGVLQGWTGIRGVWDEILSSTNNVVREVTRVFNLISRLWDNPVDTALEIAQNVREAVAGGLDEVANDIRRFFENPGNAAEQWWGNVQQNGQRALENPMEAVWNASTNVLDPSGAIRWFGQRAGINISNPFSSEVETNELRPLSNEVETNELRPFRRRSTTSSTPSASPTPQGSPAPGGQPPSESWDPLHLRRWWGQ